MFKGLGQLGDMSKMMKAAQEMQGKMAEMQERLASITVEGEAGAGMVKVTATARGDLTGLTIDPSIFRPEDKEMVEDLILAAIRDARERAEARGQEEMQSLAAEMGLPADVKLPF